MSLEETINNEITVLNNKIKKNTEQQILSSINGSTNKTVSLLNYNDDIEILILVATKHTLQWVLKQIIKKTD